MDTIYNLLPKDLAAIVEEYSIDRTNYNKVIKDLNSMIKECRSFSDTWTEPIFV